MPSKTPPYFEDEMQEKVAQYFKGRKFLSSSSSDRYYGKHITPKVYREIRIPQIGRISDVIIYLTDRRIINIECKLVDYNLVYNQAKDHLKWADYSYVCLPANTYLPAFILDSMITLGIGLLFWSPEYFVEVLQSGYNKGKDKVIREYVLGKLKERDRTKTGIIELDNQMTLKDL